MKNRFQLSATNFSMLHDVFIHEFTRQNFDQGQGGGGSGGDYVSPVV